MIESPNSNTQNPLMQAANRFVNQVFYGQLLREFRAANPMPMMGKGTAGSAFCQQLDQVLIDRITGDQESPLARALVRRLSGPAAPATDIGPAATWEGSNRG